MIERVVVSCDKAGDPTSFFKMAVIDSGGASPLQAELDGNARHTFEMHVTRFDLQALNSSPIVHG